MAKKEQNNKKEKTTKVKKQTYLGSIIQELKKVKWPSLKEVIKYTFATIIVCLILIGFFVALNLLMSGLKGLFI